MDEAQTLCVVSATGRSARTTQLGILKQVSGEGQRVRCLLLLSGNF